MDRGLLKWCFEQLYSVISWELKKIDQEQLYVSWTLSYQCFF